MGDFHDNDIMMHGINDGEEPDTDPLIPENMLTYREHLEEMKKDEQDEKEAAAEHLEMLKRVQAWHDKLRPMLVEEEKKPKYNEYEYETQMLNCFSKVGERKSFNELFRGMERTEVSRHFVSTIMLANTHNFKIINPTNGQINADTIIELLKKERP